MNGNESEGEGPKKGDVPGFYADDGNGRNGDDWETVVRYTEQGEQYRIQKRV